MTAVSGWMERWRTARALGIGNVARVAAYRGMKRTRLAKWLTASPAESAVGDLFTTAEITDSVSLEPDLAIYFSRHAMPLNGEVPWLYDPFAEERFEEPERHWSEIPDFVRPGRDIKAIWELSRFDWVLKLARLARDQKSEEPVRRMNALIRDWQQHNPPFLGPNWKCGQETTIRMLQTLLAAALIGQDGLRPGQAPSEALKAFVEIHTKRIAATIQYALAQDNNHSISEATGLYIAGAWLARHDKAARRPRSWHERGVQQLERLAARLFAEDGSFSQYSVTYHRFVIDMLAQAEWWRKRLDLPELSEIYRTRVRAGIRWLHDLTDPETGDAPNVGSNDGARLFVLSDTDYRDFRPSVQLAMKLFEDCVPYPEGDHDQQLIGLDLTPGPRRPLERSSRVMADGGFVLMIPRPPADRLPEESAPATRGGVDLAEASNGKASSQGGRPSTAWGCVRFPSFAFRPAHADALHLDLWVDGVNLLRDSGSFSYNPKPGAAPDLRATSAHNTIEFDGRDQMPRLGRFLFGSWLEPAEVGELVADGDTLSWSGSYEDALGCRHRRTVFVDGAVWRVLDEIDGQKEKAVLRWRLAPGDWRLDGMTLHGALARLSIESDQPPSSLRLVDGKESRYYLDLETIPVLEVELGPDVRSIETTITLIATGKKASENANPSEKNSGCRA
ncbi:MAG: heparinase II/III-family protein [Pseudomonadota bacterium]